MKIDIDQGSMTLFLAQLVLGKIDSTLSGSLSVDELIWQLPIPKNIKIIKTLPIDKELLLIIEHLDEVSVLDEENRVKLLKKWREKVLGVVAQTGGYKGAGRIDFTAL